MSLFGDKEKEKKVRVLTRQAENLKRQNRDLTEQIRKYEGKFEDVKEMQGIIDRLKSENQNLVGKLEKFVAERQQMKESVQKLKKDLIMKREQIEMKTFAINSEDVDVHISEGVIINGGINSQRNATIEEDAEVNGDIKVSGDITLGNNVNIKGFIEANNIRMGDGVTVKDSIRGKGDVKVGAGCTLNLIMSDGTLTIGNSTEILKAVGGKVILGNGVTIKDGIEYSDTMKIGNNVNIHGEIRTKA
ncbi:MAG: hypothetical protein U9N35_02645 [Euryarchaeota archaeon]|nr:hypothetical protein [Euryarchaeota archaeon]